MLRNKQISLAYAAPSRSRQCSRLPKIDFTVPLSWVRQTPTKPRPTRLYLPWRTLAPAPSSESPYHSLELSIVPPRLCALCFRFLRNAFDLLRYIARLYVYRIPNRITCLLHLQFRNINDEVLLYQSRRRSDFTGLSMTLGPYGRGTLQGTDLTVKTSAAMAQKGHGTS
jgi:hypothetical protein